MSNLQKISLVVIYLYHSELPNPYVICEFVEVNFAFTCGQHRVRTKGSKALEPELRSYVLLNVGKS